MIVGGQVDCFRKIKELDDNVDPEERAYFKQSLCPRQQMKELSNVYGDVIVTKHVSYENPCKIGEENVLLGINNAHK